MGRSPRIAAVARLLTPTLVDSPKPTRRWSGIIRAATAFMVTVAPSNVARAQSIVGTAPTAAQTGWTFNVSPYLWLPWLDMHLDYALPNGLGGRLPTSLSLGPGDIYGNLRFGTSLGAEARRDRVSIVTDFIYLDAGFDRSATRLRSVDFRGAPSLPISAGSVLDVSSVAKTTIWTLAGGYTAFSGAWGHVDVIAGFRYLGVDSKTGFSLATTFTGPRGNSAVLGGSASVSASRDIWNGIAGVRGRIRIPDSDFFVPCDADIGAGGSDLTWQVASGLGYQSGWAGVSVQYRHLAFEQRAGSTVRRLSMTGPVIVVNVGF